MPQKIRIFTAGKCPPCAELQQKLDQGKVIIYGPEEDAELSVHDVETEKDFPMVKEFGLDQLPTVFLDTQKCSIETDGENLVITCPVEGHLDEPYQSEIASEPVESSSEHKTPSPAELDTGDIVVSHPEPAQT